MGHKIYLSGPLFSQGEIAWGKRVKAFLQETFVNAEIIWPHEIASDVAEQIFQANLEAMNDCDLMVAILDGSQVDDGTAWEVGYFFSQGKRIVGIQDGLSARRRIICLDRQLNGRMLLPGSGNQPGRTRFLA